MCSFREITLVAVGRMDYKAKLKTEGPVGEGGDIIMIQAWEDKRLSWAKPVGMERWGQVRTWVGRFSTFSCKKFGEREVSKRCIIQVIFSFQIFLLRARKRQKSRKRGWDSGGQAVHILMSLGNVQCSQRPSIMLGEDTFSAEKNYFKTWAWNKWAHEIMLSTRPQQNVFLR